MKLLELNMLLVLEDLLHLFGCVKKVVKYMGLKLQVKQLLPFISLPVLRKKAARLHLSMLSMLLILSMPKDWALK